jgi:DNA-binding beta-propeller fold protein YncE
MRAGTLRSQRLLTLLILASTLLGLPVSALGAYTNFEITPVRPLALSPDGRRLYATNTPDGTLEIFDVLASGLRHITSVPVGLEPVAVSLRTPTEAWVVNHLSDSVSIVDVGATPPRVTRTLLVGDQPWDVVFAGARSAPSDPFPRAFVSAARRGQNHPASPQLSQLNRIDGRADVWVFEADDLGAPFGGTPTKIIQLFGDKPRPLAVSADGSRVYVGVFHSGSRTTVINSGLICKGGEARGPCTWMTAAIDEPPATGEIATGSPPVLPGGVLGPDTDAAGIPAPDRSMIIKYVEDVGEWQDRAGRNWNGAVQFRLPDLDVFAIDALGEEPGEVAAYAGVGTILFNMAVHPDGRVFVANTAANNFETLVGHSDDYDTLRGHIHEARISIIAPAGQVTRRHLNKHIDYELIPQLASTRERSLATPQGLAFSADGRQLYVTAFGSRKVGVFDVESLADDSFSPDRRDHIELSDGGPSGLVVGRHPRRLYVYTRFGNSISIVDPARMRELSSVALHNPEPPVVTNGRRFLYDARDSSSNGEASCSACHVLGDMDDLAWDLGDPAGLEFANPNPFRGGEKGFLHPVKGPMTTQTLRGLTNHGPMHWRGDQTGALDPLSGDALDEVAAFRAFNPAFEALLGRDEGPIAQQDMQAFAEFGMTIFLPPNPHRPLDNVDRGELGQGRNTYLNIQTNTVLFKCNTCHALDPARGFFGSAGLSIFDPGDVKIPHLRNVYEKVGAWGMNGLRMSDSEATPDQIRGFGVEHDGSLGDVSTFLSLAGFIFPGGDAQKRAVMNFVMAFPSNMAPMVGQQVTLHHPFDLAVLQRIILMTAQAQTLWIVKGNPGPTSCDLVVHGVLDGVQRGWRYAANLRRFLSDTVAEPPMTGIALASLVDEPDKSLTYTCVPPGSGARMGVDRDGDGVRNRDELAHHTNPLDAASLPGACSDGIDNDGDGTIDFGADPDCASLDGASELGAPAMAIDVRPNTSRRSVRADDPELPVAILGAQGVDVLLVDPSSLQLGPSGATPRAAVTVSDVNRDGYPDLLGQYDMAATGIGTGKSLLCLSGTIAGSPFEACESANVSGSR